MEVQTRETPDSGHFRMKVIAILVLVMACAVPATFAQVLYGSIAGTLTDESGAVVPKAGGDA